MTGPKTLAFTEGDAVALAKALKTFIKNHPELSIQQAFLEGQLLDAKAAAKIADLPSREELMTKLAVPAAVADSSVGRGPQQPFRSWPRSWVRSQNQKKSKSRGSLRRI